MCRDGIVPFGDRSRIFLAAEMRILCGRERVRSGNLFGEVPHSGRRVFLVTPGSSAFHNEPDDSSRKLTS